LPTLLLGSLRIRGRRARRALIPQKNRRFPKSGAREKRQSGLSTTTLRQKYRDTGGKLAEEGSVNGTDREFDPVSGIRYPRSRTIEQRPAAVFDDRSSSPRIPPVNICEMARRSGYAPPASQLPSAASADGAKPSPRYFASKEWRTALFCRLADFPAHLSLVTPLIDALTRLAVSQPRHVDRKDRSGGCCTRVYRKKRARRGLIRRVESRCLGGFVSTARFPPE